MRSMKRHEQPQMLFAEAMFRNIGWKCQKSGIKSNRYQIFITINRMHWLLILISLQNPIENGPAKCERETMKTGKKLSSSIEWHVFDVWFMRWNGTASSQQRRFFPYFSTFTFIFGIQLCRKFMTRSNMKAQ